MTTPLRADEIGTLRGFLDDYRATLRRLCAGLDITQLGQRLAPSDMTLGGMLKHCALNEHWWFREVLLGADAEGIWADVDWEADLDWDWHSYAEQTPEELDALLAAEIAGSDAALEQALAAGGLDGLAARTIRDGQAVSLRWILVHMIEEYARHCGHADLIRESIDGATGL